MRPIVADVYVAWSVFLRVSVRASDMLVETVTCAEMDEPVEIRAGFKCVEALGRIIIRGHSGGVLVWLYVWSKVQTSP